jgi:hypothetical protein
MSCEHRVVFAQFPLAIVVMAVAICPIEASSAAAGRTALANKPTAIAASSSLVTRSIVTSLSREGFYHGTTAWLAVAHAWSAVSCSPLAWLVPAKSANQPAISEAVTSEQASSDWPSTAATALAAYPDVGVTDSSILELSKEKILILTDDFALYNRLTSLGRHAININHLRTML